MARGNARWLAAFLTSGIGVGMLAWSVSMDADADADVFLFFGGLCVIAVCGGLFAWRGALTSAAMPALFVLLFPEEGPEAPTDTGGCDPFCADPVAGLDAALAVASFGLLLALFGWLLATIVSKVRRTRTPRTGRA